MSEMPVTLSEYTVTLQEDAIQDDLSASAAEEASDKPLSNKRSRDIGWEHGVRVDGNRYRWRCNWCGIIRSGGVSRLKQHLAGAPDVGKCPDAPKDIVTMMRKHLRPSILSDMDLTKSQNCQLDSSIDKKHQYSDLDIPESSATERLTRATNHSQEKQLRTLTQQIKMDIPEAADKPSSKKRSRDIGWEHGVRVDVNNRYRWRCNWCGVIRSGGVSRLKQHLAGAADVGKCPYAPKDIVKMMRENLQLSILNGMDLVKSRNFQVDNFVDKEHQYSDLGMLENNAAERPMRATNHFMEKLLRTSTQQFKMDIPEEIKEPPDAGLHMRLFDQDGLDRVDMNWRNILDQMLQKQEISEGGGINSCIHYALRSGLSSSSRNAKMMDISEDTTKFKGEYGDHYEVRCLSQRPDNCISNAFDMPKTRTCRAVDTNENTRKCQDVLVKILCSENFALLCDLLCGNLLDKKVLEMVDFSLINSKMKNGDYESSPGLFDQDIRQVWEKVKKLGQVMFQLASSLASLLPTSFQKQVGEDLVLEADEQNFEEICEVDIEQRNYMGSNTTQFPYSGSYRSTKPDQAKASCLDNIVCTCKRCDAGVDCKHNLVCNGYEAMYHLSCIEPAVKEIPSQIRYCANSTTNMMKSPEPGTNGRELPEPSPYCWEPPEPLLINSQKSRLQQNCVVCDTDDVSRTQECTVVTDSNLIGRKLLQPRTDLNEATELPLTDIKQNKLDKNVMVCRRLDISETQEYTDMTDSAMIEKKLPEPITNCRESSKPRLSSITQSWLHENSVVCDRLDVPETQECIDGTDSASMAVDLRENLVSSVQPAEPPELSTTAMLCLCKICGTCEDEDNKFLICGHTDCPYKFYHIGCLESDQIASSEQIHQSCWYCPSCLCRGCFFDTDDDKIVLCDGCDEGYHIYCMHPPLASIPEGQWYCPTCNGDRAREGIRTPEKLSLEHHDKKDVDQPNEISWSINILLSAAEKLSSEEGSTAARKDE